MQTASRIRAANWAVSNIETKRVRRRPSPPFTTSTLQQEASRKLGFSASRTMQIAQKLYEGVNIGSEAAGLITYMRTDGVQMSMEAMGHLRSAIGATYGEQFVPEKPRFYKSKAANAQEAHEAIRPTSAQRPPEDMRRFSILINSVYMTLSGSVPLPARWPMPSWIRPGQISLQRLTRSPCGLPVLLLSFRDF